MSGRHVQLRADMHGRFERLSQFLGAYLHQDWPAFYASPEAAIDDAISEYPLDLLEEVRRQLGDILGETADDTRLRSVLNGGFGINLGFRRPADARAFADGIARRLDAAILKRRADAQRAKGRRL